MGWRAAIVPLFAYRGHSFFKKDPKMHDFKRFLAPLDKDEARGFYPPSAHIRFRSRYRYWGECIPYVASMS